MNRGIVQSRIETQQPPLDQSVNCAYTLAISQEDYVAIRDKLWRQSEARQRKASAPKAILRAAIEIGLAAICFQFPSAVYLAWAFIVLAVNSVLGLVPASPFVRHLRMTICIISVGVLCLFWVYTVVFGIVALMAASVFVGVIMMRRRLDRRTYRESKHLHGEFECGFNDREFWLNSAALKTRTAWSQLIDWSIANDWLVLRARGLREAFLPVSALQRDGQYDRGITLAQHKGAKEDAGTVNSSEHH